MKITPPVPMWQQVADHLRGQIMDGTYPPGQLLPSEESLAAEFGVSRPTVRQGIQALAAEGLADIRRPRGTMVRDPRAAPPRTEHHTLAAASHTGADTGWADDGQPAFYRAGTTTDLAALLGVPAGEPMLVREALQNDGGLRRIVRLCLPFSVAASTPWADDPHLAPLAEVCAWLTRDGHALAVTDYVRARMPIGGEATTLAVPAGTPLLIVIQLITGTKNGARMSLAVHETRTRADQIQLAYPLPAAPGHPLRPVT
jgi:GntR family transcriptional regulator